MHRSLENRKIGNRRPKLSDLWDTGSLVDDADLILFLYRESVYCKKCRKRIGVCKINHERNAELIVVKHRNGATGTINLSFFCEHTSFSDLH